MEREKYKNQVTLKKTTLTDSSLMQNGLVFTVV
jgi:hypothetical protein